MPNKLLLFQFRTKFQNIPSFNRSDSFNQKSGGEKQVELKVISAVLRFL